jgi:YHS domain-containing protein
MKSYVSLLRVLTMCVLAVLVIGVVGCSSSGGGQSSQGGSPVMMSNHAECMVCKKNVDLACVDVAVDDKTPRTEYQGKTYYFCSDDCRKDFEKNPAKYAGR